MTAAVKLFYLLEFSYWLQQMLVMALKLEKPRSDYKELIAHVRCVVRLLTAQ
jgi:acyl-CoA-dependent ceramide synthase